MWSISLTTAENLTRLCAHTERPQTCARIAAHRRARVGKNVNLASARSVMYCTLWKPWTWALGTRTKKKTNLFFFHEIAQINSAAIGTSLVIRTSVHFNLTLAEEAGAYLSLKTFFCINVMTSESFFAYFQYRTEAGTSPRKDFLFGWALVCCSAGVIAYRSLASRLHGGVKLLNWNCLLFNSFFEIHNFIHRLKEQWSTNYLIWLQEN